MDFFPSEERNGVLSKQSKGNQMKGYTLSRETDLENICPVSKMKLLKQVSFLQNININTDKMNKNEIEMIYKFINKNNMTNHIKDEDNDDHTPTQQKQPDDDEDLTEYEKLDNQSQFQDNKVQEDNTNMDDYYDNLSMNKRKRSREFYSSTAIHHNSNLHHFRLNKKSVKEHK